MRFDEIEIGKTYLIARAQMSSDEQLIGTKVVVVKKSGLEIVCCNATCEGDAQIITKHEFYSVGSETWQAHCDMLDEIKEDEEVAYI